jgi:hypothetical protein
MPWTDGMGRKGTTGWLGYLFFSLHFQVISFEEYGG